MNEEINLCLEIAREQMQESIDHLELSLSKIRAGKAFQGDYASLYRF